MPESPNARVELNDGTRGYLRGVSPSSIKGVGEGASEESRSLTFVREGNDREVRTITARSIKKILNLSEE